MKKTTLITTVCVMSFLAAPAFAIPTDVWSEDLPYQDPLFVPNFVHELGTSLWFMADDEGIDAWDYETEQTACHEPPGDNPDIWNAIVVMTNRTSKDWLDVWYVADGEDWMYPFPMETSLTNFDGRVNGALAFKIDYAGVNVPLIAESMHQDAVFEVGETWEFIIQDYQNSIGLSASALGSVGVPSTFAGGMSSGSIIAIPEPTTLCLLVLGSLALARKRKKL